MGNARSVIKRLRFPLDIMLLCVRWYIAYPLSLRNLEEMMQERGLFVDHSTIHRWIVRLVPAGGSLSETEAQTRHRCGRQKLEIGRDVHQDLRRGPVLVSRLISKGTPSTSCSPPNAIVVRRGGSSRTPSRTTAFPRSSTSTRAARTTPESRTTIGSTAPRS